MTDRQQPASTRSSLFAVLIVLATVGGLVYGFWRLVASLGSTPAAAAITASATVLLSVISLIYSKTWEQRRAIEEAQREHKRGIYEDFMTFWFRTFMAENLGEAAPSEQDMQRFMADFARKLILWGSDEFLAEFVRFRSLGVASTDDGEVSPAVIFGFEQLLYAIRKDLGHANKNLRRGDILRVWINDVDTFLPTEPSSS